MHPAWTALLLLTPTVAEPVNHTSTVGKAQGRRRKAAPAPACGRSGHLQVHQWSGLSTVTEGTVVSMSANVYRHCPAGRVSSSLCQLPLPANNLALTWFRRELSAIRAIRMLSAGTNTDGLSWRMWRTNGQGTMMTVSGRVCVREQRTVRPTWRGDFEGRPTRSRPVAHKCGKRAVRRPYGRRW